MRWQRSRGCDETNKLSKEVPVATNQTLLDAAEPAALRRAADYLEYVRRLKTGGRLSLLFGVLAVVMGLAGLQYSSINFVLVAIGAYVLFVGWRVRRSPTPGTMWHEVVAMALVGAWNLIVGALESIAGSGGGATFLGAIQIVLAWRLWREQRRFVAVAAEVPDLSLVRQLDRLVEEVGSSRAADHADVVEFETGGLTARHHWKGKLAAAWALLVDKSSADLALTLPADVQVESHGEKAIGHKLKADFRWRGRHWKGTISPESMARLLAWKAARAS